MLRLEGTETAPEVASAQQPGQAEDPAAQPADGGADGAAAAAGAEAAGAAAPVIVPLSDPDGMIRRLKADVSVLDRGEVRTMRVCVCVCMHARTPAKTTYARVYSALPSVICACVCACAYVCVCVCVQIAWDEQVAWDAITLRKGALTDPHTSHTLVPHTASLKQGPPHAGGPHVRGGLQHTQQATAPKGGIKKGGNPLLDWLENREGASNGATHIHIHTYKQARARKHAHTQGGKTPACISVS